MPRTHIPTPSSAMSATGRSPGSRRGSITSSFTSGCVACHNNSSAVGMSPGHMSTRRRLRHLPQLPGTGAVSLPAHHAALPGTPPRALSCASCHSVPIPTGPYPSAANPGTCAGATPRTFKPAAHRRPSGTQLTPVSWPTAGCLPSSTAIRRSHITRSLPGPHHRVSDATFHH